MSLDQSIIHGKEYRKPYTGAKSIDKTCRNHGSCDWCKENRLYSSLKEQERIDFDFKDYYDSEEEYYEDMLDDYLKIIEE